MAKLFLSYARGDAATAVRLARALQRSGHDVWWDRDLAGGASFGSEIERQLSECDVVVVLWSLASSQSSWVRDEAAVGRDAGKLLPISVDGTEPPIGFRQFHALDLQGWHGRRGAAALRRVDEAVRAVSGHRAGEPQPVRFPSPRWESRRGLLSAGAAAAILALAVFYLTWGRSAPTELSVAVVPVGSATAAREFARDIAADMAPILAAHAENASVADTGGNAAKADYTINVAIARNGPAADTSLAMSSRRQHGIIWSKRWSVANLASVDLKQQMSLLASQAMLCAIEGDKGRLFERPGALGLYVSGCTGDSDPDVTSDDELINLFTKVVRLVPRFAPAWGRLAIFYANAIEDARIANDTVAPGAIGQARSAIAQTRRLDPHSGKALLAEAILVGDMVKALPILDRAVEAEPQTYQIRTRRSGSLLSVGRNHAAVDECAKAVELNPLSPWPRARYIAALTYDGRFSQTRSELEQALKTWPNSGALLTAAFEFHYRYGDPKLAEQLLPRVMDVSDASMVPFRKIIAARVDPTPAKVEAAVASLRDMAHAKPRPEFENQYLMAAGMFGRTDEVYALLGDPRFKPDIDKFILFRPDFAHVRADRRFMHVAAEIGLVRYWRTSGSWPDFCIDEKLSYDCKVEAAKYR